MRDGTVERRFYITFTFLPVICLDGSWGYDYQNGEISIYESLKKESYHCNAKWRGGATNSADRHKRNFHFKLKNDDEEKLDIGLLGLRRDNSWILDAGQVDMIRIRNRIATDLWNDISGSPYYADEKSEALLGTRGKFVELVINGRYQGIYSLNENLDRKQMKVKKTSASGDLHGELWKTKAWGYEVFMGHNIDDSTYLYTSPAYPTDNTSSWAGYEIKYPDLQDTPPNSKEDMWKTLYDAISFVCTSSDNEFENLIEYYFDVPVLINYYILMEVTMAVDNHGKNMVYACFDTKKSPKLTIGAWDLDETFGQSYKLIYYHQPILCPEQDYTSFISNNEHGDFNLFRRLKLCGNGKYERQICSRYKELRQRYLTVNNIYNSFFAAIVNFNLSGASFREYQRWNGDSDIGGLSLDFNDELDYIKDWITRRFDYLDRYRFPNDTGINDLYAPLQQNGIVACKEGNDMIIYSQSHQNIKIYNVRGQVISRRVNQGKNVIYGLGKGIYIINNSKIHL